MVLDICVVVPARDEARVIEATLRSLIAAGIPPGHIYLVDDCSSDNTGDIGRKLGVIVLRNDPNLGKAHAIARAAELFKLHERFEFIALMDADTLVNKEYFVEMRKAFDDPGVVTACGRPKSRPRNWITAYRANGYWNTHAIFRKGQTKMGVIMVAPGCSTVYRASIWPQLVWSKDTIVEDVDVTLQIHKKKLGRIVYVPTAVVHTQDPKTLVGYGKQMFRWNTGNWQAYRKHKIYRLRGKFDVVCSLLFVEGLLSSVAFLMMPYLMIKYDYFVDVFLINVGIVSTFALAASVAERRKDILLSAPLFPLMQLYDSAIFVMAFCRVIILGQAVTTWYTPDRYIQEKIE